MTQIRTYRFDAPKRGGKRRVDLPPHAMEQLRLAHNLKNKLIEIEYGYEETKTKIWAGRPELTDVEKQVAAAQTVVEELRETQARDRIESQSKKAKPATAAALKEARQVLRTVKTSRKETKSALWPGMQTEFKNARQVVYAAQKAARQEACGFGLYRASANDVIAHHKTAVQRVQQLRKQGKPAALRFKRWTGEGTLTVQLQREADAPVRSPERIRGDVASQWKSVLHIEGLPTESSVAGMSRSERKQAGRVTVRFSCGSRVEPIEIPINAHRPLPDGADITLARLTRRVVGGQGRLSVTLTAKIPEVVAPPSSLVAATHFGWRSLGDDTYRAAMVAFSAPVEVPDSLAGIVHRQGANMFEVRTQAKWVNEVSQVQDLRSGRDKDHNNIKDIVVAAIGDGMEVVWDNESLLTAQQVAMWRSPRHMVRLTAEALKDPALGELAVVLEAWRHHDKHLWTWETNLANKVARQRKKAWEGVAAWIAVNAEVVVVDTTNMKASLQKPKDQDDTHQAEHARRNASTVVATGELRTLISSAAAGRNRQLEPVAATNRHECPTCQTSVEADALQQNAAVECTKCHRTWDQDVATVAAMLDACSQPAEPVAA